jgi:hypothetical protein
MIRLRLAAVVCAATLLTAPTFARGQNAGFPDTLLARRADSITVGDYCAATREALAARALVRALGADSSDARSNAAIICNPLLTDFTLLALTGRSAAPLAAVARLRTNVYTAAQEGMLDAMSEFRAEVRQDPARGVLRDSFPDLSARLIRISETAHSLLVVQARDGAIERLSNYERKLGPTSARLNVAEVVLNYSAQRWIPGFKPTPLGGPSPLEVVASYAPGYITFESGDKTPIPVSAGEFGFRWYLFGKNFGKSGAEGVLLPSYFAAGALVASDDNGALVWPWRGRQHVGGYVSWGAIKVGYIHRPAGSWLVSKQFHAIPFVF